MVEQESSSAAATKIQEAAANIHKPAARRGRPGASEAEDVVRRYFQAINDRDLEGAVAMWAPGGREHVRGQVDVTAPEGVRSFIGGLLSALPDLSFELSNQFARQKSEAISQLDESADAVSLPDNTMRDRILKSSKQVSWKH